MKTTNTTFIGILCLFITYNLSAQNNGHWGRKGGPHGDHHGFYDGSGENDKTNSEFLVHYTDQDYKLVFTNDSTIKFNNDKMFPVTKIRRGMYLVCWEDKNSNMYSNVIDMHGRKVFSTKMSGDKSGSITMASINEIKPVPGAPAGATKTTEPVKKN